MKVIVYEDRGGEYRWRAVDGNHRVIADSAEGYVTRQGAVTGLDNVMNEFRGEVQVLQVEARRIPAGTAEKRPADTEVIEGVPYEPVATYYAEGDHGALPPTNDGGREPRLRYADEGPDASDC